MRHWKKCLLCAAGFALMVPMTALADQGTVTVEVKNTKGGVLPVFYYDENWNTVYLPVGEKVEVPAGTELWIESYMSGDFLNTYGYNYIESSCTNVYATPKGGSKEEIEITDDINSYVVNTDCTLEGTFAWSVDHQGYSDSGYSVTGEVHYASPSKVTIDLTATKDGKKIKLSEMKGLSLGYPENAGWTDPDYLSQFKLTGTGIESATKMPYGLYKIPVQYEQDDGTKEYSYCLAYVGESVYIGRQTVAVYQDDDGETRSFWTMSSHGNDYYLTDKTKTGYEEARPDLAYDGDMTVGQAVKLAEQYEAENTANQSMLIAGYVLTGEHTDKTGKLVDSSCTDKLKDWYDEDCEEVSIERAYKKGSDYYKPFTVEKLSKDQVKVTDSFIETDGKRYYYDADGNLVKNQWVEDNGGKVFCGEDGAIATNTIAGISQEDGLYYVGENGKADTTKNGTVRDGFITYTLVNGKVTEINVVEDATPSNAASVKNLTDGLEAALSGLEEEKKTSYADKLSAGITALSDSEQKKLEDATIRKAESLLSQIYGVTVDVELDIEEDVEDAFCLSASDIQVSGAIAAAGIQSENAEKEVQVKITQLAASASNATAANATKKVLKFKAELYVDGEKVALKAPIVFDFALPEAVKSQYPKASYTFKVEHEKDNGTVETLNPTFSDDFGTVSIRTDSFSTFTLLATKTSQSSSSGRSGSGSGSSERYAAKHPYVGQWIQDEKGWWYRFYDTSWPKSQWIELEWKGVTGWYYFNANGYMATGWKKDGDHWYYLNPVSDGTKGVLTTGWKKIDSIWYYFNTQAGGPKGAMLANTTTPDGYQVGADGAWIQ